MPFITALIGDNWDNNTNWLTGPVSSWYGITAKDGRIQKIILFANSLNGVIPPELGNLSKLKVLILCSNCLSGSIPAELGNISNLTFLGLSRNQLSGSIPAELGELSYLDLLYLACNKLTGPIPSSLADLYWLSHSNLHWNGLYTDDNDLRTFLNERTTENWESTQTIAPENIYCRTVTDTSLLLLFPTRFQSINNPIIRSSIHHILVCTDSRNIIVSLEFPYSFTI